MQVSGTMQDVQQSTTPRSASDLRRDDAARVGSRLDRRLGDDEEPLPGTHIISPRHGYLHHGIYVGDGLVVHYAGLAYGLYHGPVEEVPLAQFAGGRGIWTRWRPPAFEPGEIVRRARSR